MGLKTCIATTLLTSALAVPMATAADAADEDAPILVEEIAEYVPSEIGAGWYLRGDIAYLPERSYRHVDFGASDGGYSARQTPVFASVGLGYRFSDDLRADINAGWLADNRIDAAVSMGGDRATARVRNSAWTAMANGYVDLGTYVGITPYIGAGIGVMRTESRFVLEPQGAAANPPGHGHDSEYAFAYSLHAGAAYRVSDELTLDLGYQYLSAPDAEYPSVDGTAGVSRRKGVDSHQIRVGLRYNLR